jgi:hypothetical protein
LITKHSIDLSYTDDPCFGLLMGRYCGILRKKEEACGTAKCPFYKPVGCEDWVRVEDGQGKNLVPPEEWRKAWMHYISI